MKIFLRQTNLTVEAYIHRSFKMENIEPNKSISAIIPPTHNV